MENWELTLVIPGWVVTLVGAWGFCGLVMVILWHLIHRARPRPHYEWAAGILLWPLVLLGLINDRRHR